MKRALWAFVIALVVYAVLYRVIEHRRVAKGPWQVTFTQAETGVPAVLINQPAFGITNVQISFSGSSDAITNRPVTVTFNEARKTPFGLPFGQCVFLDTVFLPGTVVIETFGHQIQLMPRVLSVDGVERAWKPREILTLTAATNNQSWPK